MTEEYVVVEDPRAERSRPPTRNRGRVRGQRIGLIVVALLILLAMGVALAWPDTSEEVEPVPEETTPTVNAARTTALVYQEWLDRNVLVECLTERGFPYEARIVDNADSLELAAQFLELEPATAEPDAPVPMLRQPDLYLGRGGAAMAERTRGGSACEMPRTAVDADDEQLVADAVDAARADDAFLATVAEQVWVQQHPAEVTHAIALLGFDESEHGRGAEPTVWDDAMDVVVQVVQEHSVWVPVVTESNDGFAQAVGLTEAGGAVAVRVSNSDETINRRQVLTRAQSLSCGPVLISAGVKQPWGELEELTEILEALGSACHALIGAGVVEGEGLADVYGN